MKERINRWLVEAHNTFPITFKFAARGAISGSMAGFVLSSMYSLLFGIPFAIVGSIFLIFLDDSVQGVAKIGMGLLMLITVVVLLIIQCVLPSTLIGAVGGALTGLGVKALSQINKKVPFQTELLILLFWALVTLILGKTVFPIVLLDGSVDDFRQWLFIFIPSSIFVGAMVYVAKVSSSPFIKATVTQTS